MGVNLVDARAAAAPQSLTPDRPVAIRDSSGQIFLLLELASQPCANCRFGTVTHTLWSAPTGHAERMNWCSSCFNAATERCELSDAEYYRLTRLRDRFLAERQIECWSAARLAIDAMQRRGFP